MLCAANQGIEQRQEDLVATLPSSPIDGQRDYVTDSNVAASGNFGAAVATGASCHNPVYYDAGTSTVADRRLDAQRGHQ